MAVWGGSNMGTGNWKLGADLKRISFVKNVVEAHGRFRSVDLVRYIKIGSSQCAAIRVLESRNLETQKRFDFWDFTSTLKCRKMGSWKVEIRKLAATTAIAAVAGVWSGSALAVALQQVRRVMQYSSGGGDARRGSSHRR